MQGDGEDSAAAPSPLKTNDDGPHVPCLMRAVAVGTAPGETGGGVGG